MTCKWTYLAHEQRFDPGYFRRIGLDELADEGFARIGSKVVDVATQQVRVVVPDFQLSLAIGREGQNARLAARLTGYRIDIHSDAEASPTSCRVACQSSRQAAESLSGQNP